MQEVYEPERLDMKRDMDLVGDLLLAIERDPQFNGARMLSPTEPKDLGITNHSMEEVSYHLAMLIEAGFVSGKSSGIRIGQNTPVISKLTWQGPNFWMTSETRTLGRKRWSAL